MTYVLILAFVLFALDYVHNVGGSTVVVLVKVDLVVGVCCMNSFLFLDIGANVTSEPVTFVHAWLDPFWSLWGRWGNLGFDEDVLDVLWPLEGHHGGEGVDGCHVWCSCEDLVVFLQNFGE